MTDEWRHPRRGQNAAATSPLTGTPIFGTVPEIHTQWTRFNEGPIFLRSGQHISAKRGFGMAHIWAEHKQELIGRGYTDIERVPAYVSTIICTGATLYWEIGARLTISATSATDIAIIQERFDGTGRVFYSVITAFQKGRAHGTLVGAVR